jgi:hypothetical protein
MRVAFLSLPVPGHLNPMAALARKYQAGARLQAACHQLTGAISHDDFNCRIYPCS